jgi:hypothetical protein
MSVSCAGLGSGGCAGWPNNFDQPLFSFCRARIWLSGVELNNGLARFSGFPQPPLMEFDAPPRSPGKFQAGDE